jgi:hypothetical protein
MLYSRYIFLSIDAPTTPSSRQDRQCTELPWII